MSYFNIDGKIVNLTKCELCGAYKVVGKSCACEKKKTPMSNSTQNDWEDEIKDMLSDAGLKPIHFMLNNSGVRILNRIREELADARKEVITDVLEEIDKTAQGYESADYVRGWSKCRNVVAKKHRVLATLREEEGTK